MARRKPRRTQTDYVAWSRPASVLTWASPFVGFAGLRCHPRLADLSHAIGLHVFNVALLSPVKACPSQDPRLPPSPLLKAGINPEEPHEDEMRSFSRWKVLCAACVGSPHSHPPVVQEKVPHKQITFSPQQLNPRDLRRSSFNSLLEPDGYKHAIYFSLTLISLCYTQDGHGGP